MEFEFSKPGTTSRSGSFLKNAVKYDLRFFHTAWRNGAGVEVQLQECAGACTVNVQDCKSDCVRPKAGECHLKRRGRKEGKQTEGSFISGGEGLSWAIMLVVKIAHTETMCCVFVLYTVFASVMLDGGDLVHFVRI